MLQKVLELLNKTGVVYKPAAHSMSANCDLIEEDHGSFKNGPAGKKEFVYKSESGSSNPTEKIGDRKVQPGDDEMLKQNGSVLPFHGDGTPDNPWVINEAYEDPTAATSSEVPMDLFESSIPNGNDVVQELGKRKRRVPSRFQSPVMLEKRIKRNAKPAAKKGIARLFLFSCLGSFCNAS